MTDTSDLKTRILKSLASLAQDPTALPEREAATPLRRGLEETLRALEGNPSPVPAEFEFRMTGNQPLVCLKGRPISMEPMGVLALFRACGLELRAGETVILDPGLVAILLGRDVVMLASDLRAAEAAFQRASSPRERNHVAAGEAERKKLQLRKRLSELNAILEAARHRPAS